VDTEASEPVKRAKAQPKASESPSSEPVPSESPSESPSPEAPLVFKHPGASQAAFGAVGQIPIFSAPDGAQTKTMRNPTVEGMQIVFGVKETKGDWLKVQLPARPNGATGWVRKSDVLVKSVPNHIVIEVNKRKLSAFKGSKLLMEAPVGVGTSKTPTPTGNYYVDFSVKNPGSPYGAHMLSVAAFSNVLTNFGGGVGQIAIHGWGNDGSVGAFSSNGCLRLLNKDVTRLAGMAPAGTPVFILP
jgi:lipoprotein-anchoring transpeptidase ErfK/SrfK